MDSSLRSGFLNQVRLRPDAPALLLKGRCLSYGQLDETARRWAGAVTERVGRRPERIGVFGSRSEISYTATLAALYSGAAFVPMNPRFPADRTRAMIEKAELDGIFVDNLACTQLPAVLDGMRNIPPVWSPSGEDKAALAAARPLSGLPSISPERIAYLLFTSGTTGLPKGVPIMHSNVRAYVDWAVDRYQIRPEDRFSQTFDQTFDLSVFDLFVAWEAGACVYAMSSVDLLAPSKFIITNGLTVWFSVPSIPAQMRKRHLLKPGTLPTLRWSLFCGEPLPRASAEEWQAAAPNSLLENLYGPTELTISCTVHRWEPRSSPALCVNDMVPIGKPHPGLTAVLVGEDLRPVPEGHPGELCICGAQTCPGYWRDQAKTAERFIKIPGPGLPDEVYYRTGDQVKPLPTGEFAFLGRSDNQIKVFGFRVELGEIEGVLQKGEGVVQAVAMGWPISEGTAQGVIAFVTGAGVDIAALKSECKAMLSDYMVPNKIVLVDEMPLNANGKVDRTALKQQLESGSIPL